MRYELDPRSAKTGEQRTMYGRMLLPGAQMSQLRQRLRRPGFNFVETMMTMEKFTLTAYATTMWSGTIDNVILF